jgi:hypothetical protein
MQSFYVLCQGETYTVNYTGIYYRQICFVFEGLHLRRRD